GTTCAPLVRVPGLDEAEVKVALDAGAEGIFFPMVRSASDVERCVETVTYPPEGSRGWGPFVAHARHAVSPGAYSTTVGPHMTWCVQIETLEAVQDIDAIVRVPGVDLVMIAPFDLSCALGIEGRFDEPRFVEAVQTVERAVAQAGVALCGVALDARRRPRRARLPRPAARHRRLHARRCRGRAARRLDAVEDVGHPPQHLGGLAELIGREVGQRLLPALLQGGPLRLEALAPGGGEPVEDHAPIGLAAHP